MKFLNNRFSLFNLVYFSFLIFFASSCTDDNSYTPKPRGFPKVIYPEKSYQKFTESYCPMNFEYPKYAVIEQDKDFFGEKPINDCWFDISIPKFNGKIHCTYYDIDEVNSFEKLRADVFNLAGRHNIKADYIDELPIQKSKSVTGFAFDIEGAVASPFIFYLSDQKEHFFTGSLYFRTKSRPDSLAPIYDFIKKDIMHLFNTFEWKAMSK